MDTTTDVAATVREHDTPTTPAAVRAAVEILSIERQTAAAAGDTARVLEIRYEIGRLTALYRRLQMEQRPMPLRPDGSPNGQEA